MRHSLLFAADRRLAVGNRLEAGCCRSVPVAVFSATAGVPFQSMWTMGKKEAAAKLAALR
jgi:hypothetical protein